jgi:MFS transporter, OFA family, oxalate/formate antiporter
MENLKRMDDIQRLVSSHHIKLANDNPNCTHFQHDHTLFGLPAQQGRWVFIPLGIVALLCLGTVYSWSIFRKPIELAMNAVATTNTPVSATDTLWPFAALLFTFSVLMPCAGRFIEEFGATKVTGLGGVLVGLGYFLSGSATTILELVVTYGVIAGAGVGIVYGVPIAIAAKWFPDHKGLAVGLTVVGFGLSPLVTAPLAAVMIEHLGINSAFRCLGIAFAVILLAVASQLRFPPADGLITSPATPAIQVRPVNADDTTINLVRRRNFVGLWCCYAIGTLAGLMAIGIASSVGKEIIGLDAATSIAAVSLFAIFNGIGRPIFGWLTQRLGPATTAIISFALIYIASVIMLMSGKGQVLNYFFAFGLLWLSLGGWLAIAPTATLLLFGSTNYSRNYGVVFTAFGVGALLGTWLAGCSKDMFGSYTNAFFATGVLAVIGGLIATYTLRADDPSRQRQATRAKVPGSARTSGA